MRANFFVLANVFLPFFIALGCSQTTYRGSTFQRTVTTNVEIHTNVPAQIWIADRNVGTTPLSFPFTYEEEVSRNVKTANYWETNPGAAAALSVLSFGVYVPFSFIPADPTSESHPTGKYINNRLSLRLVAEGYAPLEYEVECKGEPIKELNLSLAPKEPK